MPNAGAMAVAKAVARPASDRLGVGKKMISDPSAMCAGLSAQRGIASRSQDEGRLRTCRCNVHERAMAPSVRLFLVFRTGQPVQSAEQIPTVQVFDRQKVAFEIRPPNSCRQVVGGLPDRS